MTVNMNIVDKTDINLHKSHNVSALHPAIMADRSEFWLNIFDKVFSYMTKKAFYSYRVKGAENFELRNKSKANIFFATHGCWWDGIIAFLLLRHITKTNLHMMIQGLRRFPLLSKAGGFSVEKDSPQASIRALQYAINILNDSKNSLWIFPQGRVCPPDYRPLEFANGISYLCNKLDGINLIPIAHRYNFVREDRPEVFVEIGKPITLRGKVEDKHELTEYLENVLTDLHDKQRLQISQGDFKGYEFFFKNKPCLIKRVEHFFTGYKE